MKITNTVVREHVDRRNRGEFNDPKIELAAIERIIEEGLTQDDTTRTWAYGRQKVLKERIYNPSPRYATVGVVSGSLKKADQDRVQHATAIKNIMALLDK